MGLPDLDSLPDMFERTIQGRTLILDSDFPAYQAAATVKKLPTALTRFQTLVETERFVTGAELVRVHLTPRGCTKCRRYDYPTVKPYQANRTGKVAPPLLHPLRAAIQQQGWPEHWQVLSWKDREADDGMMMDAIEYGDRGIILSGDKDLNITPGPLWIIDEGRLDFIDNRFGWIAQKQLTSSTKVVGHGTKFFWAQMLMGDTADNVKGIIRYNGNLCGPAGAYAVLNGVQDESEAANLVLRAYAKIQQDPLAEAQCLWLRRSLQDCAYQYLCELDLDADLRAWLDALHEYHQQVLAIKLQLKEEQNESGTEGLLPDEGETEPVGSAAVEAARNTSGILLPWED